jgi:dTDP-4-dehydrorhamnose reductase
MPGSGWGWCGDPRRMSDRRPILVLGHLGQVGSELMRRRQEAPAPLVGCDRDAVDIGAAGSVRALFDRIDPGLVINVAAYTGVDKAEAEPEAAYAANRDGPANLASACGARRIPLIHVSTDYVFDGQKCGPYLETDAAVPTGVYGASKLAGEAAVAMLLETHVILRTAWVFSVHGSNFLKTILRLSGERPELRVVDDQHGCPTSAAAIAEALLAVAARIGAGRGRWGLYHFAGAPPTTWWHFASAIVAAASRHRGTAVPVVPIASAEYPTAAKRPENSVLDCAKIEAAYGLSSPDWRPDVAACVATLLAKGVTA